jgi:tRNA threonylcarbamoyladenosine modification (KEOPS) complex  Pcc1 subunit
MKCSNFDSMKQADVSIKLDKSISQIVIQSMQPELDQIGSRTKVRLIETDDGITLSFDANDISSLRAALNSYLRWLDCIIATTNEFGPGKDNKE